jgi:hypothetical protein
MGYNSMNNPSEDQSEFDFYISANRDSPAAQEIAQVLGETGYSVYLPARNNEEAEADRIAANRSKAIVLILTKHSEQTQIDLDELLNILSVGDAKRRVIILQFEECEIAKSLDRNSITKLVGLNSHDRALRILASAGGPLAAQSDEIQPYSDWAPYPEETPTSSADAEAELRAHRPPSQSFPAPPMLSKPRLEEVAAKDVVFGPSLREATDTIREATTYSHKEGEEVRAQTPEKNDIIEFGVSHPTSVTIGVAFIVDVLIYRQDDRWRALERAAELRPENDRFGSAGATEVVRARN